MISLPLLPSLKMGLDRLRSSLLCTKLKSKNLSLTLNWSPLLKPLDLASASQLPKYVPCQSLSSFGTHVMTDPAPPSNVEAGGHSSQFHPGGHFNPPPQPAAFLLLPAALLPARPRPPSQVRMSVSGVPRVLFLIPRAIFTKIDSDHPSRLGKISVGKHLVAQ